MKKEDYVTICPKCKSTDISFEKNLAYVWTGLLNQFKECKHCGHHELIFPKILKSKVPKNPKNINQIKDRELVQTSFGRGYYKYFLYIEIPLFIIMLIIYLS